MESEVVSGGRQLTKLQKTQAGVVSVQQRRKKHLDQQDAMESFASPKRHQKTDGEIGLTRIY